LLTTHCIEWLVTKNAGGEATRGKLEAARALGLRVIMVQRPQVPARAHTDSVDRVMHWLAHGCADGTAPSMP
jgi:precorrin-6A/cobalt-precorrin-6A reductase